MSCVLTLALDDEAQHRFESLRQRFFPPERNLIPAHLTLFHTLPEDESTRSHLAVVAAAQPRFPLTLLPPRSIGRGVAFFFEPSPALALHRRLSEAFRPHLTAQDTQGFRPHVVVQNKVSPDAARETLQALQAQYTHVPVQALGLDLWRYLGGPWEHLQRFDFAAAL